MKTLKLIGKITLFLALTIIVWLAAIYVLSMVYKLNNNVSGGVAYLLVLYFWGVFLLYKQGLLKILGIVLFTIGVLINLVLIASPYDTQAEFISTRIFIAIALAAGIFLIFRQSIASKIFGILILLISIFGALLGAFFMFEKLN